MADVFFLARRRGLEEFLGGYEPTDANAVDSTGSTLLHAALHNKPGTRAEIAGRLLDDGADAAAVTSDGVTTAHVLLGRPRFDLPTDAPLLERLLDGGSDPNRSHGRFGTPLLTIARQLNMSDEALSPFYDVLLARPDLDLLAPAEAPTYQSVRLLGERRDDLISRMDDVLRQRGQSIPT